MAKRASGILLHITSLSSKYGIGDLGPEAYKFADFLKRAKQRYWQVLPLNQPTLVRNSYSPYNCLSAFAGNTLLISPELLYRNGFLSKKDIKDVPAFPRGRVDYHLVIRHKIKVLNTAYQRVKDAPRRGDYKLFCSRNRQWLEDYAAFAALRRRFRRRLWYHWPQELRDRNKQALKSAKVGLRDSVEREKFLQYLFFHQWFCLKRYCNRHGIKIIGDVPIYVYYDSADVWANPEIFKLTKAKKPRYVAGVPPDYFSRSGQLWGNPVYDWKVLKAKNYYWWKRRIRFGLSLFDMIRIDHFRGFIAYWQVPAGARTAAAGKWVSGPKQDFFSKLFKTVPSSAVIAEDLGHITPDVRACIERFRLPGMKVLLFAFDKDAAANPHWLDNHNKNSVVYTGTHDNNTVRGWFEKEAKPLQKRRLVEYLGHRTSAAQVSWELVRLAMSSVAGLVVVPMQDVLGLGGEARMNHPATSRGNWTWRLLPGQASDAVAMKLAKLVKTCKRV